MEINLNDQPSQGVKEALEPQILSMMDPSGKKVDFEIVSVVTMEKRIFIITKNPNAKEGVGKLVMFEYVTIPVKGDPGKFVIVQNKELLQKVTEEYKKRLAVMDEMQVIPREE